MRARRTPGAACLALLLSVAPRTAGANTRFPAANEIVFSPSNPRAVVGRTTFGILPSRDDGATWRWLCEDAIALPPTMTSDPEMAMTASDALVVGVPSPYLLGVSTSSDLGCNWSCAGPLAGMAVADVVLRPTSTHSVLALASAGTAADGGFAPPQVFETKDDGATWAPLRTAIDVGDPSLVVFSIDVAKSDPARIYVSATRGYGAGRKASLFVSSDDGATWNERRLAQFDVQGEGAIFIGGVDPTDADRVYVRSSGILAGSVSANASCDPIYGRSRLIATANAGATFNVADLPVTCQILGFALSEDGSRVYAGTFGEGLFAASRSDLKFAKTSSVHVECLATRGPELWACSDAVSGFIFGVSTDEGACFLPKLPALTDLAGSVACSPNPGGPLACQATNNGSVCTPSAFQSLCSGPFALSDGCFSDAGATADAGCGPGDAGGGPKKGGTGGGSCACSTVGGQGLASAASAAALVFAAGAALRRRRRA